MADLMPIFNSILKEREAPPAGKDNFSREKLDEFLKEAYLINSRIASLHDYLRSIRQAYLSTAPPRKSHLLSTSASKHHQQVPQHLTDEDKEQVDVSAKQMLRELHGSVRVLADAEKLRRDTEAAQIRRKYVGRLGALGAWAAGGGDAGRNARRSPEHAAAEETAAALAAHREGVLWLLRTRLGEAADTQRAMMDIRLSREMERNRSVLAARSRGPAGSPGMPGLGPLSPSPTTAVTKENGARVGGGVSGLPPDEGPGEEATQQFSPEQVQMFERDNQDMLRHYESTLDQVRTAERSLIEISELQTQLVANLETQAAHIDQLVADSLATAENVGGGNRELKKATERRSTAQMTFYAACGLSAFLIVWDLLV